MARTIQSPGVELREIDFSIRPATLDGTTVFVAGYSNQGPVDEILQPTSLSEFEQIYGIPTNPAEQYFYQSAKALFNNSPAKLITSRLPYGEGKGEGFNNWRYSAVAYPAVSFKSTPTSYVAPLEQSISFEIADIAASSDPSAVGPWTTLEALSGAYVVLASTHPDGTSGGIVMELNFDIKDSGIAIPSNGFSGIAQAGYVFSVPLTAGQLNDRPAEVNAIIENFIVNTPALADNFIYSASTSQLNLTMQFVNLTAGAAPRTPFVSRIPQVNVANRVSIESVSIVAGQNELSNPVIGGSDVTSTMGFSGGNVYFLGKPTYIELDQIQYNRLLTENIDWANQITDTITQADPLTYDTLGKAALIILNKAQVAINNSFEGYFVGLIDNNNYNPATPFNGIGSIQGVQANHQNVGTTSYVQIPETRMNFSLSATSRGGDGNSISEVMENLSPFELDSRGFDDTLTLGLFKLRKSIYTPDTVVLDYVLSEKYVGSLDYHRRIQDQNAGSSKSLYLGELVEGSPTMKLMVNPWISNRYLTTWLDDHGVPQKKVRVMSSQLINPFKSPGFTDTDATYSTRVGAPSGVIRDLFANTLGAADALYPLGVYVDSSVADKKIGQLPLKLERALDLVENSDIYPINIAIEAGLGTIFVNSVGMNQDSTGFEAGPFIDSLPLPSLSALYVTNAEGLDNVGTPLRSNYMAVANSFISLAEKRRKDFIVILDPIRNIFIQGSNTKVINTKTLYGPNAGVDPDPYAAGFSTTNFSQHIYWPLRHQFGAINSSFAVTYANIAQVLDGQSNRQIWVPFSGFAAAAMANTDFNFNPWSAPAGFTRGVVTGINDLGVYPRQNQRDQLYKIALNPVTFFPGEGFVIFGQKTTLKKPSAFDRINVRRLFLYLETITKNTLKYFVFEPNTLFTRTQVINTLTPVFDNARNTEGIYDYLIVCDERNNTPDVIDNNELKVDIYIKPVRTAEFILVSFYATRTSQNFQELIGG